MIVNDATGEVTVELAGKTFCFHATMRNVAKLQAELGAKSFAEIHEALLGQDVGVICTALRTLCTSGNSEDIDDLPFGPTMGLGFDAIYKTLAAGLPDDDAEASKGNGSATKGKKAPRLGRGTGNSLSA